MRWRVGAPTLIGTRSVFDEPSVMLEDVRNDRHDNMGMICVRAQAFLGVKLRSDRLWEVRDRPSAS